MSPDDADALAARLLSGMRTRLGGSEIAHARRVARGVAAAGAGDRVVAAALLHDVVERGVITLDELFDISGDQGLVTLVRTLTHGVDEPEADYLARCAADPDALSIKRVDLRDKLVADDIVVPPDQAIDIQLRAQQKLAALEELAGTADPGGSELPPPGG